MSWYLAGDGWFATEPAGFRLRWVAVDAAPSRTFKLERADVKPGKPLPGTAALSGVPAAWWSAASRVALAAPPASLTAFPLRHVFAAPVQGVSFRWRGPRTPIVVRAASPARAAWDGVVDDGALVVVEAPRLTAIEVYGARGELDELHTLDLYAPPALDWHLVAKLRWQGLDGATEPQVQWIAALDFVAACRAGLGWVDGPASEAPAFRAPPAGLTAWRVSAESGTSNAWVMAPRPRRALALPVVHGEGTCRPATPGELEVQLDLALDAPDPLACWLELRGDAGPPARHALGIGDVRISDTRPIATAPERWPGYARLADAWGEVGPEARLKVPVHFRAAAVAPAVVGAHEVGAGTVIDLDPSWTPPAWGRALGARVEAVRRDGAPPAIAVEVRTSAPGSVTLAAPPPRDCTGGRLVTAAGTFAVLSAAGAELVVDLPSSGEAVAIAVPGRASLHAPVTDGWVAVRALTAAELDARSALLAGVAGAPSAALGPELACRVVHDRGAGAPGPATRALLAGPTPPAVPAFELVELSLDADGLTSVLVRFAADPGTINVRVEWQASGSLEGWASASRDPQVAVDRVVIARAAVVRRLRGVIVAGRTIRVAVSARAAGGAWGPRVIRELTLAPVTDGTTPTPSP